VLKDWLVLGVNDENRRQLKQTEADTSSAPVYIIAW